MKIPTQGPYCLGFCANSLIIAKSLFCRYLALSFCRSVVLSFCHSVDLLIRCSVAQLLRHSVATSLRCSVASTLRRSVHLSLRRSVTSSLFAPSLFCSINISLHNYSFFFFFLYFNKQIYPRTVTRFFCLPPNVHRC